MENRFNYTEFELDFVYAVNSSVYTTSQHAATRFRRRRAEAVTECRIIRDRVVRARKQNLLRLQSSSSDATLQTPPISVLELEAPLETELLGLPQTDLEDKDLFTVQPPSTATNDHSPATQLSQNSDPADEIDSDDSSTNP